MAYKWTVIIGLCFLGSFLWSVVVMDGWSDLISLLLAACFLASTVASIVIAATRRSKAAVLRVALNGVLCLLLLPIRDLGALLRNQVFLKHLPEFQEATSLLVKAEASKRGSNSFDAMVALPPKYYNLNVSDRVFITSTPENLTVRYATRNSSAVGHAGYLYRSDDNSEALHTLLPSFYYTRIAPQWFYYVD